MMATITPDGEEPLPRSKSSFWKTLLLSFLSAAAVMLVWLFYPLKAPRTALRERLPEACAVSVELHAPAALNSGLLMRDFCSRCQKLPVYPLLAELLRRRGFDLDAAAPEIQQVMRTLDGTVCGLRNCMALAAGVTAEAEPQIVLLFAVDNLGLSLVRLFCLAAPKADNGNCSVVRIPENLQNDRKIPDFYLKILPKTRYVTVATRPEILREFRPAGAATVRSRYADGHTESLEMTVRLDEKTAQGVQEMLPASAGRVKIPEGEVFLWWEYEKIGGEARMRIPANTVADKMIPQNGGGTLAVFAADPQLPGLSLAGTMPAGVRPAEMLAVTAPLLASDVRAAGSVAAFLPPARRILQDACGHFCLRLLARDNSLVPVFDWTVTDPQTAQNNVAAGLEQLIAGPRKKQKKEDFLARLAASVLLAVRQEPGKLSLRLPLLGELFAGFTAEKSPQDCIPGPIGGYAALGNVWPLPKRPGLQSCAPRTLTAGRITWCHSPEIVGALQRAIPALQTAAELGGGARETGEAALAGLQVLDSLANFTGRYRISDSSTGGAKEAVGVFEGTLRLPPQSLSQTQRSDK